MATRRQAFLDRLTGKTALRTLLAQVTHERDAFADAMADEIAVDRALNEALLKSLWRERALNDHGGKKGK